MEKRKGWEMVVWIERVVLAVLQEVHERQAQEAMGAALSEGPEGRAYSKFRAQKIPMGLFR